MAHEDRSFRRYVRFPRVLTEPYYVNRTRSIGWNNRQRNHDQETGEDWCMINLLLGLGADIHAKDDDGSSPMHSACRDGRLNAVRALLSQGAYIMDRDNQGATPMHLACDQGHYGIVEELLKEGTDVDALDGTGRTCLHVVCTKRYDSVQILSKLLFRYGADLDVQDAEGDTPLHLAVRYKNMEIVTYLLNCGADFNIENRALQLPIAALFTDPNPGLDGHFRDLFMAWGFFVHITKLQTIDNHVHPRYFTYVRDYVFHDCEGGQEVIETTREEKEKMTRTMINPNVSYYQFLRMNANSLANFFRTEGVEDEIRRFRHRDEFPHYHRYILSRLRIGLIRKRLLDTVVSVYHQRGLATFPLAVIQNIFECYSDRHIKSLIGTPTMHIPEFIDILTDDVDVEHEF